MSLYRTMKNGKKRFAIRLELWNVASYDFMSRANSLPNYDEYIEDKNLPFIPKGKYTIPDTHWHEHKDLRALGSRFLQYHFKKYNEVKEIMEATDSISNNDTVKEIRLMWAKLFKSQEGIDKGFQPVFVPYKKGRLKTFL